MFKKLKIILAVMFNEDNARALLGASESEPINPLSREEEDIVSTYNYLHHKVDISVLRQWVTSTISDHFYSKIIESQKVALDMVRDIYRYSDQEMLDFTKSIEKSNESNKQLINQIVSEQIEKLNPSKKELANMMMAENSLGPVGLIYLQTAAEFDAQIYKMTMDLLSETKEIINNNKSLSESIKDGLADTGGNIQYPPTPPASAPARSDTLVYTAKESSLSSQRTAQLLAAAKNKKKD